MAKTVVARNVDLVQFRSLFLPGTIAIPPFPSPGTISKELWKFRSGSTEYTSEVLVVRHCPTYDSTIVRTVRLSQVVAVVGFTAGTNPDQGNWRFSPEVEGWARGLTAPVEGSVFVAERAAVWTEYSFGAAATDSVEFTGLAGARCDECFAEFAHAKVMKATEGGA